MLRASSAQWRWRGVPMIRVPRLRCPQWREPGEQGPTRRTHERTASELARRRYADGGQPGRTLLMLESCEHLARPTHRFVRHRCEQPLRVVRPAHRLGDCAGRSPGSRVVTLRPAFPVAQWLRRTKGSPRTVAGAATAAARCSQACEDCASLSAVAPTRVPSCLPGVTRGTSTRAAFRDAD